MTRTIFIWLIILLSFGCTSNRSVNTESINPKTKFQQKGNNLISPELLRLDIDQLVESVEQIHPEAFSLTSQATFLMTAEQTKRAIHYPLTRNEFYLRIAPLLANLRDIHSHITLPKKLYRTENTQSKHRNRFNRLFPLAVLYEKEALYVAADLTATPKIPTGSVITSINEMPINFILEKMGRLTAWETEAGLRRKIQIDFPWLLAVMGYASVEYRVEYIWKNNPYSKKIMGLKPIAKDVSAQESELTSILTVGQTVQPSENLPMDAIVEKKSLHSFYGHSQLNQDTALLWFNDFYEEPVVFEAFLNQQFEQFAQQGVKNLIIDVRYNDGGLSQNIRSLLSQISEKPIRWSYRAEIHVSEAFKRLHQVSTKQRRQSKFGWGLQWLPLEWTDLLQYEISWSSVGEKIDVYFEPSEPAENYFKGDIKVLTNGFCYSACAAFVAAVNINELAETVGETAGSIARVQYVYPISTLLTHSQLTLSLPTVKIYQNEKESSRQLAIGVSKKLIDPKIMVKRSLEAIIQRDDSVLNEALKKTHSIPKQSN